MSVDGTDLKSLTREELRAWVEDHLGERSFRGDQIFQWLHQKSARSFAEMSDVSAVQRLRLAEDCRIGGLELTEVLESEDGTKKLLLRTATGDLIESVIIPMEDRITQCISSQIGCKIGCDFCLTARMPIRRNLSAAEIVDQVLWARHVLGPEVRINNLVYMGMGEPLDNYDQVVKSIRILLDDKGQNFSSRRITVSTSGVVPKLETFGHDVPVNLAVSLNASHDEQRTKLIPINKVWNISTLIKALKRYPLKERRRITMEYVLLDGVNDTDEDAQRLAVLLRGLRCKVNLIPFNPWPGAPYGRPSTERVEAFGRIIRDAGYSTTVRYSKGEDIGAACGQLDGAAS
jgi:23S rRNA (adenine2503-C2)-methyltransferase